MNRIVLAFLALFAGLAAQVAPAQARMCGQTEVGLTLGAKVSARVVAVAAAAPFRAAPSRTVHVWAPDFEALPLPAFAAPSVRLRVDRTHE